MAARHPVAISITPTLSPRPTNTPIGLGSSRATVCFYIANRPPIDDYPQLDVLRPLASGELAHIVEHTSNHWRKVFNVYAKVLFDWYGPHTAGSWQEYRDQQLFQQQAQEALLFSTPPIGTGQQLHIIAGKTYAQRLDLPPLTWLDAHFAIHKAQRLIVAPYPDYRQLSNARIAQLIQLMNEIHSQ